MDARQILGARRFFIAFGGFLSAASYLADGLTGRQLGAHDGLFVFYVACSLVQVASAIWLVFSRSMFGGVGFLVVFACVAAFDVFMLQPVQSGLDYLGIGVFILAVEMMGVAWWSRRKSGAS